MPGKSDVFEFQLLQGVFHGAAVPNVFSTGGTTSMWMGFHTATPGEEGSTAAEGGYAQYARTLVTRTSTAWTVTSGTSNANATATPTATVSAPQNTSTSTGTFTFGSVWPSSNATSTAMLYYGALTPNINFSQNVTPQITTASSITED